MIVFIDGKSAKELAERLRPREPGALAAPAESEEQSSSLPRPWRHSLPASIAAGTEEATGRTIPSGYVVSNGSSKRTADFGKPRIRCFESYPSGGPISQDSLRSGSPFERLGHACRDWLGSLSRDLLSERAKVFILRRSDVELLAHLSGRQLDKLQRRLHTH
jgi:hypothetical protein